ncbi:hypothetical protein AVEN_127830-1 [Araneus ventricosus]|uniref:RNase H type-1 domain-containing protein n=1 Tax=Araneus ventricosus TaxID=182803 RepID=A0A4Y1ZZ43_ARAVE|nr:hypothetical protein AVEN_127830-1 [Araneus ventricosus]
MKTYFTDGNKINSKVGLAFVVYKDDQEVCVQQLRIHDECTVFQVELLCSNFAVKWVKENEAAFFRYVIFSDSLSSVFALLNIKNKERLVIKILAILRTLNENHMDIFFTHVKGHCRIFGNERDDFLANALNMPMNINVSNVIGKDSVIKSSCTSGKRSMLLHQKPAAHKSSSQWGNTDLKENSFFCSFKATQFLT